MQPEDLTRLLAVKLVILGHDPVPRGPHWMTCRRCNWNYSRASLSMVMANRPQPCEELS